MYINLEMGIIDYCEIVDKKIDPEYKKVICV